MSDFLFCVPTIHNYARARAFSASTACVSRLVMRTMYTLLLLLRWRSWKCIWLLPWVHMQRNHVRLKLLPPPPRHTLDSASTSCATTRRGAFWQRL